MERYFSDNQNGDVLIEFDRHASSVREIGSGLLKEGIALMDVMTSADLTPPIAPTRPTIRAMSSWSRKNIGARRSR
jgi:hypothetical protein